MPDAMELKTFLLEDHPDKKMPKWKRMYHVAGDGAIFVSPCICGMNDKAALMALMWDGNSECVQDSGHIYVTLEWLMRQFPQKTDFLMTIRGIARGKHGLR